MFAPVSLAGRAHSMSEIKRPQRIHRVQGRNSRVEHPPVNSEDEKHVIAVQEDIRQCVSKKIRQYERGKAVESFSG